MQNVFKIDLHSRFNLLPTFRLALQLRANLTRLRLAGYAIQKEMCIKNCRDGLL